MAQISKNEKNLYRADGARRSSALSASSRKKARRRKRRILQIVIITVCLAILAGAGYGISRLLRPKNPGGVTDPATATDPAAPGGLPGNMPDTPDEIDTTDGSGDGIIAPEKDIKITERDGVTYLVIQGHEMVLVNKTYAVPASYGADIGDLTPEASAAYDRMKAAAAAAGYNIFILSGYRSYDTQAAIHQRYLDFGQYTYEYVKQMSAEAGHSEHQLGLALDIGGPSGYDFSSKFGQTDTGKWLNDHAHEYGYILRYMEDKTWATGYMYEPWHFRYVGVELATILYESGLTVEEYAGLV